LRKSSAPWVLFLLAAVLATPAHAHGSLGSSAPFWSGVLHFAISPLAIATVIGLTAAIAFADDHTVLLTVGIAAATALIAVQWAPSSWSSWVPVGTVAAGSLAVSGWRAPRWFCCAIAALAGIAIGVASEPDVRSLGGAFGVGVMVMVIASAGIELLLWIAAKDKWRVAAEIGRRVIGAWVAAVGLLLGALALLVPANIT
jgi:hypothetical protein